MMEDIDEDFPKAAEKKMVCSKYSVLRLLCSTGLRVDSEEQDSQSLGLQVSVSGGRTPQDESDIKLVPPKIHTKAIQDTLSAFKSQSSHNYLPLACSHSSPLPAGISYKDWYETYVDFIANIYQDNLQCNTADFSVILLEDLEWSYSQKRAILNIFLNIGASGILPMAAQVFPAMLLSCRNCLVVDIGYVPTNLQASASLLFCSKIILTIIIVITIAKGIFFLKIFKRLRKEIIEFGSVKKTKDSACESKETAKGIIERIADDIFESHCGSLLIDKKLKESFLIEIPGKARSLSVDNELFISSDLPGDGVSVPEAVAKAILGCTPEIRAAVVARGVFFTGGGASIPGVEDSICKLTAAVLSQRNNGAKLTALVKHIHVIKSMTYTHANTNSIKSPWNIRGWLGASVMGFAGAFNSERAKEGIMTQEFYDRPFKSADEMPDWSRPGMDKYRELKEKARRLREADGSYSNLQSEDSFEEEKEDNDSIVVDDEDKRKRPVQEIGLLDDGEEEEEEDDDDGGDENTVV
eukprot:jgi/Bigna1/70718/fgenesh1_pg.13_\